MAQQQDDKRRRQYCVISALMAVLFAVYVLKGIALYAFQRHFFYVPPERVVGTPSGNGLPYMKAVETKTEDGLQLQAWFMPPTTKNLVVIYFHGNADDLTVARAVAPVYHLHGYGLLTCEYRGYSGNPGEPTEQGLYADARACVGWLKNNGYGADRIILHGHSIGTGVAVEMAMEFQPKILVLESAFTSVADMAKDKYPFYPIDLMIKDRFDSISKIGKVTSSLLMVHGARDGLVPIAMGHTLFDAANKPKAFVAIKDAGHDDLYLHDGGNIIANWLDKQAGAGRGK